MADTFSKSVRHAIMSKIRSKNTFPEVKLRKVLWSKGIRYRLHYGRFKIDLALLSRKIGIFVDGCFWHGCKEHCRLPNSNKHYWLPKIKKNMARDKTVNRELKKDGWLIMRIWEHDIKNNLEYVIKRIEAKL